MWAWLVDPTRSGWSCRWLDQPVHLGVDHQAHLLEYADRSRRLPDTARVIPLENASC